MLIEIPDGFEENFIQMLIEQMHNLQVDMLEFRDESWDWQEKYIALSHKFDEYKKTHKKK